MDGVRNALALVTESKPVNVQIVPGVTVAARARRHGNFVTLEMSAETPLGPIVGHLTTDIASFERMVEKAHEKEVLPRAAAFLERHTGHRPLLKR